MTFLPAVIVVDHSVDIDLIAQLSQEADGEPTRAEETSRRIPEGAENKVEWNKQCGLVVGAVA